MATGSSSRRSCALSTTALCAPQSPAHSDLPAAPLTTHLQLPLAESGGNLAESDGAAPQGTAVTPSSAGFATAPHWMVALLAGAALAAAQLA